MKKKHEIYIFGYPLKGYLPIILFFSVAGAISIILGAIEEPNFWVEGASVYLLIVFFLYNYSTSSEIQSKDYEIAKLMQEIKKLEDMRKSNEFIIELLEKELDKAHDSSNKE